MSKLLSAIPYLIEMKYYIVLKTEKWYQVKIFYYVCRLIIQQSLENSKGSEIPFQE